MKPRFTTDNSLVEILTQAGPEMSLYFPSGMADLIPQELHSQPIGKWMDTYIMPWGIPLSSESLLRSAAIASDPGSHHDLIPLWDENPTVSTNDIHSSCLMRLKEFEESNTVKTDGEASPAPGSGDIRPAVIIVPGGGYENIAFMDEGFATARMLEAAGYKTFILNYRFKPNCYPLPQTDLALAVRIIRANAEKYQIDPDNLMTLGYSAGGHLCASEAALYTEVEEFLDRELAEKRPDLAESTRGISVRPDKVCLCYPVISFASEQHEDSFQALTGGDESLREHLSIEKQVTPDYPKAFVWTCADDSLVPPSNAVRMGEALQEKGVPCMLRVYPTGEHGCNVGKGTSAEGWISEMVAFMK